MEKLDDFDTGTKQEEKNVIQQGLDIVLSANTVSDYSNKSSNKKLPRPSTCMAFKPPMYRSIKGIELYYLYRSIPYLPIMGLRYETAQIIEISS